MQLCEESALIIVYCLFKLIQSDVPDVPPFVIGLSGFATPGGSIFPPGPGNAMYGGYWYFLKEPLLEDDAFAPAPDPFPLNTYALTSINAIPEFEIIGKLLIKSLTTGCES